MTPERLALERFRDRTRRRDSLANMSPQKLASHREQQRNYQRLRAQNMTDAERAAQRERQRILSRERKLHARSNQSSQISEISDVLHSSTQNDLLGRNKILSRMESHAQSEVA
ncbi:hypothetical protein AQUCO_02900073v1 [Aquilegia coerulea]|uniref:Uncharacterized protein n=1 Tax=Aquilegia coerulea TaxID=218851 RepID=A0A2G5D435_AQUCA|nr:hypothetical protein AQUCO_02900073v1 [Aquilegia coerulea]